MTAMQDDITTRVSAAEEARCAAMVAHDAVALAGLLHDRFVYCHTSGLLQDKQSLLDRVAGHDMAYLKFEVMEREVTRRGPALFSAGRMYVETQRHSQVECRVLRFTAAYTDVEIPICLALHVTRMGEKTFRPL